MAKNRDKPRPGVVFRFSWIPVLEKLGDEAKARFLMACLYRGRDCNYELNTEGLSDIKDAVRLETIWETARIVVDEDGQGWSDTIMQRRFAGYVSSCNRKGEKPLEFEEYREWYETIKAKDPDVLI